MSICDKIWVQVNAPIGGLIYLEVRFQFTAAIRRQVGIRFGNQVRHQILDQLDE